MTECFSVLIPGLLYSHFIYICYVQVEILYKLQLVQMINMELVQVATCTGSKFVHVATCTSQPVQVATCTSSLYKLQLVQISCTSCNLYKVSTCT